MNEQATFDALQKQLTIVDHTLHMVESEYMERVKCLERVISLSGTYDEYTIAEPVFYEYVKRVEEEFDTTIFFDFEADHVTIYDRRIYEYELGHGIIKRHRY